jgi:rRNA maturation endonuclease Nob1
MIDRLTAAGSCIYVHSAEISLKITKSFTHGSLVVDQSARTATFGKLPAVALPVGLDLAEGDTLNLQLVAPDGTLRKQTRSGVLKANEKQPGILRIAGTATSERRFSAADGWGISIYKYRAYFTHPGINTNGEIPSWLKGSIARQRGLWNRLAWLCRDARRSCSPVPTEEVSAFAKEIILPAINTFNDSLGRSKQKMKHPAKLKTEAPGVDGLWKFVGELRKRIEKDLAVPDGLLEKVVAFAEQFKADYTPLNEFLNSFQEIADREAGALVLEKDGAPVKLRSYEKRPTIKSFKAVLDRRKTAKAPWSEGWPLIKFPDSPKAENWGLHFYLNKAGVETSLLETEKGVPGLTFGPALLPAKTGHTHLVGDAAKKRKLREAEISIAGEKGERWEFKFGVLQHRPLPENSHVKEWKLIYQDGKLWLCLVVELQRPIPVISQQAAGLDIGWRRTEEGIRFGTLYEPESRTFRELNIDLQKSPKNHSDRVPFRIDLGPTRWEKRNITSLLPDWKPGDAIPSAFEIRPAMQSRRSYYKDTAKLLLRKHIGDRLPMWFDKAGSKGLFKLGEELKEDATVQEILSEWRQKEEEIGKLLAIYFDRSTKRIEYGHAQVAHDVCRYLMQKGTTRLMVETSFLARTSQQHDNEAPDALKNSQKYRQFAAVAKFVSKLKNIAAKYGIVVDAHDAINTTRICHYCNHLNPSTEKDQFSCEACGSQIKQDQNASVNLSRFAADPDLAEMALLAGKE